MSSRTVPAGLPRRDGKHAETTAERWRQLHDLLERGTGLLECSRRLNLSLNTVKRYARAAEPERMIRAPAPANARGPLPGLSPQAAGRGPGRTRPAAARRDPRAGLPRQHEPALPVHHPGQSRSRPAPLSPKSVTRRLLTRPGNLNDDQRSLLEKLATACPEMTSLAELVRSFATLLRPDPGNQARLADWTETARVCDLPHLHAFTRAA